MIRRELGWALVAYGILGLVLVVAGAIIGLDAAARVERLASEAAGTLQAAARSTRAAADSFASVDGSLANAQDSADEAAVLAGNASATLDALAVAMGINVLGTQPLQSLADDFAASADDARELGDTLASFGGSLSDTRTDAAAIGAELTALSDELDELGAEGDDDAPPLRAFVLALLAWIAAPSVGALIYGGAMLRPGPSAVRQR